MIDIENIVFNMIVTELRTQFPGINVYSRLTFSPSAFPCVCIEEADNMAYRDTQDSGSLENHAEVMYEINVFSNLQSGAKQQCRQIFAAIDDIMASHGFSRYAKVPVLEAGPIQYRLTGRYRGVVSSNNVIYSRR